MGTFRGCCNRSACRWRWRRGPPQLHGADGTRAQRQRRAPDPTRPRKLVRAWTWWWPGSAVSSWLSPSPRRPVSRSCRPSTCLHAYPRVPGRPVPRSPVLPSVHHLTRQMCGRPTGPRTTWYAPSAGLHPTPFFGPYGSRRLSEAADALRFSPSVLPPPPEWNNGRIHVTATGSSSRRAAGARRLPCRRSWRPGRTVYVGFVA